MTEINDLIKERRRKVEAIRKMGVDPFGGRFLKKRSIDTIRRESKESETVQVAGRITAMRLMGKTTFCDLKDETGRLQLFVKPSELAPDKAELFGLLDIGDIVGVAGDLFTTKTGELSIRVKTFDLLAKSLRPLPEKWHGLKDVETRYRQRYLDLLGNDETKEIFKKRSRIIRSIRESLDSRNYLEVETPMMHPIPGGAAGKPFKTHHEALKTDLFLRVAPELYLKKLLVGGFDRVYEVNKSFRNEGISTRHNPEFTMLEVYTAYQDVNDVMELTERLIREAAEAVCGSLEIPAANGEKLDLSSWERLSFADIMRTNFGINPDDPEKEWLKKMKKKGVAIPQAKDAELSRTQLINIVGELLEPGSGASKKGKPVFVTDYFTELCPLAKKKKNEPALSDRFELYIGGMEIANGYSELNDPLEQRERLSEELKAKGKDSTFSTLDEDFLTALEHGMPPAGGLGIGIDRLVMILTNQPSIREVILFPQMRSKTGKTAA